MPFFSLPCCTWTAVVLGGSGLALKCHSACIVWCILFHSAVAFGSCLSRWSPEGRHSLFHWGPPQGLPGQCATPRSVPLVQAKYTDPISPMSPGLDLFPVLMLEWSKQPGQVEGVLLSWMASTSSAEWQACCGWRECPSCCLRYIPQVNPDTGYINYEQLEENARLFHPKLIIAGDELGGWKAAS